MSAEIPVAGPTGPVGPTGPPGPVPLGPSGRRYGRHEIAGNYGYEAPDHSDFHITDQIDLRVLVAVDTWTPASVMSFISKWDASLSAQSWSFGYNPAGRLRFLFSTLGTDTVEIDSSGATSDLLQTVIKWTAPVWLRVVAKSNDGTGHSSCAFYFSYNEVVWTQIGPVVTNATPGPFFSGAASVDTASQKRTGLPYVGRIYEAQIRNGSGTLVGWMDYRVAPTPPATFTDAAGTPKVWTPRTNAELFQDEQSWQDFLPHTLTVQSLIPAAKPGYWLHTNAATGECEWVPLPANTLSATDAGAVGDYVTDDHAALQGMIDTFDDILGGTLYLPGPPLTLGRYRIGTPGLVSAKRNLGLTGDLHADGFIGHSFSGATNLQAIVGGSHILADAGVTALRFGDGNNYQNGPQLRNLVIAPLWLQTRLGVTNASTTIQIRTDQAAFFASWPTTGDGWLQDVAGKLCHFHYTGIDLVGTQFTGVTIDHEMIAGTTYSSQSLVTMANTFGIRQWSMNNSKLRDVMFCGFNDQTNGSYGLFFDDGGTGHNPQYNKLEACIFAANNRGLKVTNGQAWAHHCLFDGGFNNTVPMPNEICVELIDTGTGTGFSECMFQGTDTLISQSSGPALTHNGLALQICRFEAWGATAGGYAIKLAGVNRAEIMTQFGSSHNNRAAVSIDSACTGTMVTCQASVSDGPATGGPHPHVEDAGVNSRIIELNTGQQKGYGPPSYKPTASRARPTAASLGAGKPIYDEDLALPLWSDGTNYRDAAGTIR